MDPDYQTRLAEADKKREIEAQTKLTQLDKERPLLLLKSEILQHIDSFIQWIDLSNEWFLRSRNMSLTKEERGLAEVIYQFYKKRSDLILNELPEFAEPDFNPKGLIK